MSERETRAVIVNAWWKDCFHGGGWWIAKDVAGNAIMLAPDGFVDQLPDISQASVAAALEAAANEMWPMLRSMISRGDAAKAIRALITIDQHDALSAHVAAEVAKARAEDAAKIEALAAELQWYGEQARLCRLIHSEGDAGRHALNNDGGKRAAAALAQIGAKP